MMNFLNRIPFAKFNRMRPLKNGNFYSSSRKVKISTTGIYLIFRELEFEPDAEIGQKVPFCKGLRVNIEPMKAYKQLKIC